MCFILSSASYAGLNEWEEAARDAAECIKVNKNFVKGEDQYFVSRPDIFPPGCSCPRLVSSARHSLCTVREDSPSQEENQQIFANDTEGHSPNSGKNAVDGRAVGVRAATRARGEQPTFSPQVIANLNLCKFQLNAVCHT